MSMLNQTFLRLADAAYVYAEGKSFMFRFEPIITCVCITTFVFGIAFTVCYCVKKACESS